MNQGTKANFTGKEFHQNMVNHLMSCGYNTKSPPLYEALWGGGNQRNQADIYLPESNTQIECKFQGVPGTADQKAFAELYNAHQRIKCDRYILLFGGKHWESTRGNNIYKSAKEFANFLNQNSLHSTGAKKLSVMKVDDFDKWLNNDE
tara:strand:+ start:1732 stop:2175 length:444 start_codon:yes stop_codon:yes gene_type:complete